MVRWVTIVLMAVAAVGIFTYQWWIEELSHPFRSGVISHAPSLAAIGGSLALSGDTIQLGGEIFALNDISCPDPSTERGRAAKALANTFLKMDGTMTCDITFEFGGRTGDCTARSHIGIRNLSEVMRASGYCS